MAGKQIFITFLLFLLLNVHSILAQTQAGTSWYNSMTILTCICGMILGCFFIGFGYRFFYVYMFAVGFVMSGGLLYLLLVQHSNAETTGKIILSLIVGSICGTVTLLIHFAGIFCGGAFVGFLIAAVTVSQINNLFLDWLLIIVLPIILGGVACIPICQKPAVIISSSFSGAYAIVAGIDYFSQGQGGIALFFPRLINGFKNITPVWLTWLLISVDLLLTIIGIYVQFRHTGRLYEHSPLMKLDFGLRQEGSEYDPKKAFYEEM
eukprot:TRINITY_DN16369_c0_g1_i1.p1 TRINITY_DN16369_c0_g1~~TRINITY_DN16369_c0_g1_i1.p1  ORF type:complete len:275 (+),score=22.28 TRINITY_DN16369_c0_g1_i1:36-827(+)